MRESVNIKKAASSSLKATLNLGAARNRKPKAELLQVATEKPKKYLKNK